MPTMNQAAPVIDAAEMRRIFPTLTEAEIQASIKAAADWHAGAQARFAAALASITPCADEDDDELETESEDDTDEYGEPRRERHSPECLRPGACDCL